MADSNPNCKILQEEELKKKCPKEFKILDEVMILVPVARKDFEVVNSLAESYLIVRHPNQNSHIKLEMNKILQEINE